MLQSLIEFLKGHYSIAAYLIALIFSLLYYKNYFDTVLKYLPIIIAYTFFNEILGYFVRYTKYFSFINRDGYLNSNGLIYNIHNISFYLFFCYIFVRIIKNKKYKKSIKIGSVIIIIAYAISAFYQNPVIDSLFYASSIGSWVIFLGAMLYFFDLKTDPKWVLKKNNLMFWIALGIAIFYLIFPILYLIGFLNYELWQKLHLRTVLRVLIVIMYSLFSIGFIVSKRGAFR